MLYSIILTFFNEDKTIGELVDGLERSAGVDPKQVEIILVDDGSTDKSPQAAHSLKKRHRNIRIIRNNRNMGRGFSLEKGIAAAKGGIIGIIDTDLQYQPADLLRLLRAVKNGKADLICGRRIANKNNMQRRMLSLGFNLGCRFLFSVPVHDSNSGIKAGRKKIFEGMPLRGGAYRLIAARANKSHRVAELSVQHRKRRWGNTRIPTTRIFIETLAEILRLVVEK